MALGPIREHDENVCPYRNHCTMCMLCGLHSPGQSDNVQRDVNGWKVSGTELHRKSRSQKLQYCSKPTQVLHCTQEAFEQGMDRHTHRSGKQMLDLRPITDGLESYKGMYSGGVRSSSFTFRQQVLISLN